MEIPAHERHEIVKNQQSDSGCHKRFLTKTGVSFEVPRTWLLSQKRSGASRNSVTPVRCASHLALCFEVKLANRDSLKECLM